MELKNLSADILRKEFSDHHSQFEELVQDSTIYQKHVEIISLKRYLEAIVEELTSRGEVV